MSFLSSNQRVDVTFFLPNFHIGGAQKVALEIANGLSKRGKNIEIIVLNDEGLFKKNVSGQIKVKIIGKKRVILSLKYLIEYFKAINPISFFSAQTHGSFVVALAILISKWKGRFITRQTNTHKSNKFRKFAIKDYLIHILFNFSNLVAHSVIAPSQGIASEIKNIEKVKVVPNPINFNQIIELSKENIENSKVNKQRFILGVGRCVKQKRFEDLVKAFALTNLPNSIKLVIIGEGPERKKINETSKKCGIEDKVIVLDYEENPFKYMSKCELFVLTSGWEGMPSVLIQALACGAKVISTDCDHGPKEILNNGEYGSIVPVGDIEKIKKTIENDFHKDSSPKNNYLDYVKKKYDLEIILNSYENIFGINK
tara:strand:+ start:4950 stop:6059 length:1110 start_codon:yes stop_codon:yes gene_type:complete